MAGTVFISYCSDDRVYVDRLVAHLRSAGLPVWYDDAIRTGDRFGHVIEEQIRACTALVVVMTPAAHDSRWVAGEVSFALEQGRPVLPLLLAGRPFLSLRELDHENVTDARLPGPRFVSHLAALTATPSVDVPPVAAVDPGSGIVIAADARGAWAWAGVAVDSAVDLTGSREYERLSEAGRLAQAVTAETAWLAGQWDTAYDSRIDLRYRTDPVHRGLSCAVLGRVFAPDEASARTAAAALRRRLADVPGHVRASEIDDAEQVRTWLAPFDPHPHGVADIRKNIRVERPNRPDAGVAFYVAVDPFVSAAPSWEPLWQAMVVHPHPVLLSVNLAAAEVGQQTAEALHQLATRYGRLGGPGHLPGTLFSDAAVVAPDAFAGDAARLYADAARRYSSRVFRARVSLASPAPLPDALTGLVGFTMSPPERPRDAGALTQTFRGPTHVVVRPHADELAVARRNLAAADNAHWDAQYVGGLPTPPPPLVRLVATLVDPREASALARLPLAPYGRMPGFPVR